MDSALGLTLCNTPGRGLIKHVLVVVFIPDHGTSPPAAMYETYYVTAHKGPCRTASFSQNGLFVFLSPHVKLTNISCFSKGTGIPSTPESSLI